MYSISDYSYKKAKEMNVVIKPSKNKKKKIDVFKDEKLIASIGAKGYYKDYGIFLEENGKEFANKKRLIYRKRHKNDLNNKNGNGYWANKILW